jgi:predicted P-loop ATPase
MQPGCKADNVPVIIGKQGMLKSTGLATLCPDPAWFTDDIPLDIEDRDTKATLAGKLIIELAEFPQARKDAELLKGFLSRQVDRFRAPYGRVTEDHPRQGVLAATTNRLVLPDETGSRRKWPVQTKGPADVVAIARDRDQLWAEAYHLYKQDTPWHLPANIEAIAREVQAEFTESDPWDSIIVDWAGQRGNAPFTMNDLFAVNTGIMPFREPVMTQKTDEMRAARCLIRLGWTQRRARLGGPQKRYWWPA